MTEARRRASASYKSRLEGKGVKVVSVRLPEGARTRLKGLCEESGLSQGDVVSAALFALDLADG